MVKQNSINKASEELEIDNSQWLKSTDSSGTGEINVIRVNSDDEIDIGAKLNIGEIEAYPDSGLVVLCDLPVTSNSPDGTEMSWTIKVGATNILKIYAESNGAGGVDTFKVRLLNKAVLTMEDSAGTTHTYT